MLKKNALVSHDEESQHAVLFDTYTGKKYAIPYEIGLRAERGALDDDEVEKLNSYLADSPIEHKCFGANLAHLRLLVTNCCNFNCTYCFADQGSYGLSQRTMTRDIAKAAIDYFFRKYDRIGQVSFFGGEPLLAIEIIEYVCSYISSAYKSKIPAYSLVTNGYLLNHETVKILKRYNIAVIVSHDGPEVVHDQQRRLNNGGHTFSRVDENLIRYRNDFNFGIEATYTSNHEKEHISRENLSEYFRSRYGITRVSINDVGIESDALRYLETAGSGELYQLVDFFQTEGIHITDFVYQLMVKYLTGNYCEVFCDAGIHQFAVDMDGNIYPCHRFVGKPEYILATVEGGCTEIEFSACATKKEEPCASCKYKLFCQACTYAMVYSEEMCTNIKKCIEYFLNNMLSILLKDREKYDRMIQRCIDYGTKHRVQISTCTDEGRSSED